MSKRLRRVAKNERTNQWAYLEVGDEGNVIVLGDKVFETEQEADEWSKGFEEDSYVYRSTLEVKIDEVFRKFNQISTLQADLGDLIKEVRMDIINSKEA